MTQKFPLTNWSEKKAFTIKLGAVKKYHIAVFADPNCPWCKRFFEENMDKLNDLEVFVYLAPVLGEDSEKLAAEILSEKDPAAAWTDWVMNECRDVCSDFVYIVLCETIFGVFSNIVCVVCGH